MKFLTSVTAAAALALLATGASAQSAKFDASWSDTAVSAHAKAEWVGDNTTGGPTCVEGSGLGTIADPCLAYNAAMTVASLHVAQQKDLLIGVSAEITILTLTQAKGKSDTVALGQALAEAGVKVSLELRDADGNSGGTGALAQVAAPGEVTFAARTQELKVGVTDTDTDFLTEVIVSLKLETTAAHHFNFLGVDLDQGDYDVVANFNLSALAGVLGESAVAEAMVVVNKRMVTVQEVRAAKDSLTALSVD
ncbi:MAG TPA: hypothetical protein VLA52_04925 [Thermohalobaculum sp.]|nr:hypothetical protein [Thermohalobaculum sp.]